MSAQTLDLLANLLAPASLLVLAMVVGLAVEASPAHGQNPREEPRKHPFLICTRDQFQELIERGEQEPWATMKENALRRVKRGFSVEESRRSVRRLQSFLAACALAYIVEPDRRPHHAGRLHDAITDGLAELEFNEDRKWAGVVAQMGAAFLGTIALDIVYDDLSAEQITECESVIESQIGKINRRGAWSLARRGTHGTWDIYTGRRTSPDDAYYERYVRQMTEDGVMVTATNYAWARLASTDGRLQKTGYADVLEFTGIDRRYYDNPRLQKFYRWLYAHSITPARQLHAFGDFIPGDVKNAALARRAGRFDPLAGRYMAWALEGFEPPGHVMAYVLKKEKFEPKVPSSRLYSNGGAFLREPEDSPDSLGAALYNIASPAMWHAHQETNALSLSAYGARLLMNGGWLGPTTRPAKLNNTLTIDGKDHRTRSGAGLQEGLTAGGFDYAAGLSGDALPGEASCTRSLILLHGRDGADGYFLVLDEVEAEPGSAVHHYVHPSTDIRPEARTPETEYDARINLFNDVTDSRLAVFYGNEPQRVTIEPVPSGSDRVGREEHYRLEAVHPVEGAGGARILTVLFPHDRRHRKAEFSRITSGGVRGVLISHENGARDRFYAADGDAEQKAARDVRFRAQAVVYRTLEDTMPFYFVRRGTKFRSGGCGFFSNRPVSLLLRGATGRISAGEETKVTFFHPGITGVRVGGDPLEVGKRGDGRMEVEVPAGNNQTVTLVTGS